MTLCPSRVEPKAKSKALRQMLPAPCSMRYAKIHTPMASLWRARLSVALMRE
jgi:hypothetical protein